MVCKTLIFTLLSTIAFSQNIKAIIDTTVVYPKVAYAIYAHETAYGTSKKAILHNNLFGFKSPRSYKHTKNGYSIYKTKTKSILDYAYFESKIINKHNIKSSKHYLTVISKIYATDKVVWLKNINKIMKTL